MTNKPFHGKGNWRHGAWHRNPKLYNTWATMMHRCEDPKHPKFRIYGGRGIEVCNKWHDPNAFMDWAETHGYREGLQIDRIDNDGPYSPQNCRWTTAKENCRNTRRNRFLTVEGERLTVAEWAERTGTPASTIYGWMYKFGVEGAERRVGERAGAGTKKILKFFGAPRKRKSSKKPDYLVH